MSEIRLLKKTDIGSVMRLNQAAGWNQTPEDWERLIELAPEGCFVLDCDGAPVATASAVCYGRRLAWIGMVLTHPDYRGRGYARRLMEHSLEYLERLGIEWIKLDATDMGRPLYLRLGFEDEGPIERWAGTGGAGAGPMPVHAFQHDAELDLAAFGADRGELLSVLSGVQAVSAPGGFAMGRSGVKAAFFGPSVARSSEAARILLQWFLAEHPGERVFWDLLPGNAEAVSMAREFGFAPVRKLVRMGRQGAPGASPLIYDDSLVFAIAGFEYG